MTENEKKMPEQIYAKVSAMEKKITNLESNVGDLKNVHTGLQATFENGFSEVRKELSEIIEINKNRKTAKEIVEGIAGKEDQ
ncbi:TPA: chromosome segregation protein SMC [Bacillus paranthracis]